MNDFRTAKVRRDDVDAEGLGGALVADMGKCWEAGERPSALDYFAAYPELEDQRDAALRLIYEEICLRQDHGEELPREQLLARYSQWANELDALLACHSLLADCTFDELPQGEPSIRDYSLVTELGRGGQGRVFLARQNTLDDRPVVLKISQRRGNEHLTLARLQHTNIVPLYSATDDADQNTRILCMPYFGGATLQDLLAQLHSIPVATRQGSDLLAALDREQAALPVEISGRGPMRQFLASVSYEKAIAWIGSCLAEALQFAHERDYVHLDIKPANILLAADGQPMLLDFHVSQRPLAAGSVAPTGFGGTRSHMSPEQRDAVEAANIHKPLSADVDQRSDIYSLGLVLFEALGGNLPPYFADRRPDLAALPIARGLQDILARCLASTPADRYPSAAALAEDLRCHVQDLPLKGLRNRSLSERWGKWRRRRPAALPLGVMIGAVLLAAISLLLVSDRHERAVLQEAENSLINGKQLFHQRRHAESMQVLKQGIQLAEKRNKDELTRALQTELDRSHRAHFADRLHTLAEVFRQHGSDPSLSGNLKNLDEKWRSVWEQRTWLAAPPADGLSPAEHERVKTDLLDLALIWSDMQVRLAPANARRPAQEHAWTLLNEAEAEFGASPALLLRRAEVAEELGLPFRSGEIGKPRSAWEHYALGRALLNQRKFDQASELLERAVELDPQGYWSHFYLGLCALQREDFAEADSAFRVCIALAPESVASHYNRGLALAKLGRVEQAIAALTRALQIDNGYNAAAVHYRLALLHEAQGNWDAAHAAATAALRITPAAADVLELLRRIDDKRSSPERLAAPC